LVGRSLSCSACLGIVIVVQMPTPQCMINLFQYLDVVFSELYLDIAIETGTAFVFVESDEE